MTFKNAVSWFEIPTQDLSRAQKFYEAIFQIQMVPLDTPQIKMRMFPLEDMMGTGVAVHLFTTKNSINLPPPMAPRFTSIPIQIPQKSSTELKKQEEKLQYPKQKSTR